MSKFTPGPWECDLVNPGRPDPDYYTINATIPGLDRDGVIVDTLNCDSSLTIEEQRANAHLIEATHDLLAVCRSLDEFQRRFDEATFGCGMPGNDLYAGQLMVIVAAARDAIAKAIGGQP